MKITIIPTEMVQSLEVTGLQPGQAVEVVSTNVKGDSSSSTYTVPGDAVSAVPSAPVLSD